MRPLHVGDDFLGHPNGAVPTPIFLSNLVSNHFATVLLLDHISGAFAFVLPVGLCVYERTLDCNLLLVLLISAFSLRLDISTVVWTPRQ